MSHAAPAHKRILLKLSGEALMGDDSFGINRATIVRMVEEIAEVTRLGVQVAVVIGGGNIFRGVAGGSVGMDRATADYMGMLATVMNGLALQDALESLGCDTRLMTAIKMEQIAEPFIRRRAMTHLAHGKIVIFGAGTGNPYFTTDTAAALRAIEIGADAILKGTKVDGVYDKDPVTHADAVKYDQLSYMDVIRGRLKVMDTTAVTLCMENDLPIQVFNLKEPGNLLRVILGESIGTKVTGE